MANSKIWVNLTDEQKRIKRIEYRERYKQKHPERFKEQREKYKENHKEALREKASIWQKEKGRINKLKAIEYLGNRCADCGNTFPPYVYDFHHINPDEKDFGIARIIGRTWGKIIPELDKCVLLCANCHRIRHNENNF